LTPGRPRTLRARGPDPEPDVLARARDVLWSGQLLIYPTDTLYALGARVSNRAALGRIREAKGREEGKPFPLIASDLAQARSLCACWPEVAERLTQRFWPGPLTLLLPARDELPEEVRGPSLAVAVRVPDLELARRLCAESGPLVSTSANRAGEPAPRTCEEAVRAVGGAAALALDAGPGAGVPSTIIDVSSGEPRIVRPGALAGPTLEGLLRKASDC
jgi:L-threonylcarbamoyladenylate synthase